MVIFTERCEIFHTGTSWEISKTSKNAERNPEVHEILTLKGKIAQIQIG